MRLCRCVRLSPRLCGSVLPCPAVPMSLCLHVVSLYLCDVSPSSHIRVSPYPHVHVPLVTASLCAHVPLPLLSACPCAPCPYGHFMAHL